MSTQTPPPSKRFTVSIATWCHEVKTEQDGSLTLFALTPGVDSEVDGPPPPAGFLMPPFIFVTEVRGAPHSEGTLTLALVAPNEERSDAFKTTQQKFRLGAANKPWITRTPWRLPIDRTGVWKMHVEIDDVPIVEIPFEVTMTVVSKRDGN